MELITINKRRHRTYFKCNSGASTLATYDNKKYRTGLSCYVYEIEGLESVAICLTSSSGFQIDKSIKILTAEEYAKIAALYDPYSCGQYHTALLEKCGATNQLKVM